MKKISKCVIVDTICVPRCHGLCVDTICVPTCPACGPSHLHVNKGKECSRLTLRLLMSYIYGAPSKARNANVVYIWTYVWQR